jgi:trans-aconitate methyltransferase
MKIEDYLASLPGDIISGEDVELPDETLREIFRFAEINESDVFYHLGCGNGKGIAMAIQEFGVKRAIGIDNNHDKILNAQKSLKEKQLSNYYFRWEDVSESEINDATIILFWFSDEKIVEKMITKISKLNPGCRIITLWGPLAMSMPDKVNFPFILNVVPLKKAGDVREQMIAIFGSDCIDFAVAWEFAERYSKAISSKEFENDRFLTILQTLVIWINAKNLGIACGDEIPVPVKNYISILKTFFNIEVEHLLERKEV